MAKIKLDDIDHQILDILIDNMRTPFTDIAKRLLISLQVPYMFVYAKWKRRVLSKVLPSRWITTKMGYSFIAYVGIYLEKTHQTKFVLERLNEIPYITVAHITTGKFNIYCKVRAKTTEHAKEIIFKIDDIDGVLRTETMISLEESINDKKRLMHTIFNDL